MKKTNYIESFWEESMYSKGKQINRYPFDAVVSFVNRNYPKKKDKKKINILEIGSGAGNNLWFAAREGFNVTGIDGSKSAIEYAINRFKKEELNGKFVIGNFANLSFLKKKFDLVIDRASITCCSFNEAKKVIEEINRVLLINGRFYFNPYSSNHTSFLSGKKNDDGTIGNITSGTLSGIDHLYFYNIDELKALFPESNWKILSIEQLSIKEEYSRSDSVHSEFRLIAEKI